MQTSSERLLLGLLVGARATIDSVIEIAVILQVNKELPCRAVDRIRACKSQCTSYILQTVFRFIEDLRVIFNLTHVDAMATRLNDILAYHAMEYRSRITAIVHVGEKICDAGR